ncbi:hypothetical protein ES319_D12G288300v1 [Gossypium barbadense]|uniref:Uncharacterized protein n=2 Tax=Gossypium TaxID=3633 RepID=A0A5J5P467_GOSBA|nr:hypothetical protein ES319_D12G288300v1 [Gossypium barbadense]TYG43033.1 hypothetical protein ES288_D12G304100v1 [Gossypium darwinii]
MFDGESCLFYYMKILFAFHGLHFEAPNSFQYYFTFHILMLRNSKEAKNYIPMDKEKKIYQHMDPTLILVSIYLFIHSLYR